jgi:hypothetical protein
MSTDILLALLFVATATLGPVLLIWRRRFSGPAWAFAFGGFIHMFVWIAAGLVTTATFVRIGLSLWANDGKILSLVPFGVATTFAALTVSLVASWVFFDRYGRNGDKAWREMVDRGRAIQRRVSEARGA